MESKDEIKEIDILTYDISFLWVQNHSVLGSMR